jgi:hypothetical protein
VKKLIRLDKSGKKCDHAFRVTTAMSRPKEKRQRAQFAQSRKLGGQFKGQESNHRWQLHGGVQIRRRSARGQKDGTELSEYFGDLRDNTVLDKLEAVQEE